MADNTRLNPGSGGDVIRTEEIGGQYKIAVSKIVLGPSGVDGGPVTPANPLPVAVQGVVALAGPTAVEGTVAVTGPVTVEGTVAVSGPVTVQGAVALAGPATVQGAVAAVPATGVVAHGSESLVPRYAAVAAGAAGANTLVAAVPGRRIRVLQYVLLSGGAVTAEFRSGVVTPLTGPMPLAEGGGVGASASVLGQFETATGEALALNLSAAVPVAGHLCYVEA